MTLDLKCPQCGPTTVAVLDLTTPAAPYTACRVQCRKCRHAWASRAEAAVLAGMGFTNALADLLARRKRA